VDKFFWSGASVVQPAPRGAVYPQFLTRLSLGDKALAAAAALTTPRVRDAIAGFPERAARRPNSNRKSIGP
jgi:hypothetical protein